MTRKRYPKRRPAQPIQVEPQPAKSSPRLATCVYCGKTALSFRTLEDGSKFHHHCFQKRKQEIYLYTIMLETKLNKIAKKTKETANQVYLRLLPHVTAKTSLTVVLDREIKQCQE